MNKQTNKQTHEQTKKHMMAVMIEDLQQRKRFIHDLCPILKAIWAKVMYKSFSLQQDLE